MLSSNYLCNVRFSLTSFAFPTLRLLGSGILTGQNHVHRRNQIEASNVILALGLVKLFFSTSFLSHL